MVSGRIENKEFKINWWKNFKIDFRVIVVNLYQSLGFEILNFYFFFCMTKLAFGKENTVKNKYDLGVA